MRCENPVTCRQEMIEAYRRCFPVVTVGQSGSGTIGIANRASAVYFYSQNHTGVVLTNFVGPPVAAKGFGRICLTYVRTQLLSLKKPELIRVG